MLGHIYDDREPSEPQLERAKFHKFILFPIRVQSSLFLSVPLHVSAQLCLPTSITRAISPSWTGSEMVRIQCWVIPSISKNCIIDRFLLGDDAIIECLKWAPSTWRLEGRTDTLREQPHTINRKVDHHHFYPGRIGTI